MQAAFIIAAFGLVVYFGGLANQFQGDDLPQIVNNVPVHSIGNIGLFFEGGTFYNNKGLTPLAGIYYRPLMTTTFSMLYTLFGPHALYFHLLQLALCIGSAVLVYLVLTYSFSSLLSLALALVFLLHPIDSQAVYAIPSMQDALFFFFGILAIWLLLRFHTVRSLFAVAGCLLLSLLSKESGVLFAIMSVLYLWWFDRGRLRAFGKIAVAPIIFYAAIKLCAVGWGANPHDAPIDNLSFAHRLLTAPAVLAFYIGKFLFPWKLASGYYWTYQAFSFSHVLLPLLVDAATAGGFVALGFAVRWRLTKAQYYTYLFFGMWASLGLVMILQLVPLDMTVCETWFYFSMMGVLGMIGVGLTAFQAQIRPVWFLTAVIVIIGALGLRTALRAHDWRNQDTLARADIAASREDYNAYDAAADSFIRQGKFEDAKRYTQRSLGIYPAFVNYLNLGVVLTNEGDYQGAIDAYGLGLKHYSDSSVIYEDLAALTLLCGTPDSNKQFLLAATAKFPQDATIWMYLAILEDRYGDNAAAKVAVTRAASYGQVPAFVRDSIMDNVPFVIYIAGKSVTI